MAFPRLFAWMLLASLFLYWTTSSAQSHDLTASDPSLSNNVKRELPFETREKVKESFQLVTDTLSVVKDVSQGKKFAESAKNVLKKFASFASAAPGCIGVIFSVVNVVLAFIPQNDPVLDAVKEGFAEVNRKLDSLSIQVSNLATDVEWFNYASVYAQDEVNILNAWRKFSEFQENSELTQSPEEKLSQAEIFANYYEYTGVEASVDNLYHYLTVSSTSLSKNLNELLREKFKCDIREIFNYNFYFNSLMLKGVVLNEVYWKLTGLNSSNKKAKYAKIFKNIYRAQKSAVYFCLDNFNKYMKEDVLEISKRLSPENQQHIALKVKEKLDEKYNWYEWVVLVYKTDERAKYELVGLEEVSVDKVTVAVGHKLKTDFKPEEYPDINKEERERKRKEWNQKIRTKIDESLKQCVKTCELKEIEICMDIQHITFKEDINTEWYKLFSVKIREIVIVSHVSTGTDFAEEPKPFYTHTCHTWTMSHTLVAVHFSWRIDVCSKVSCGQNGQCKMLTDSNEYLCECQDGYHGDRCEKKMDTPHLEEIERTYRHVPRVSTTKGRLKVIESKLDQIVHTCRG